MVLYSGKSVALDQVKPEAVYVMSWKFFCGAALPWGRGRKHGDQVCQLTGSPAACRRSAAGPARTKSLS